MNNQDPIADMLTRIRNANRVGRRMVLIPKSKICVGIAHVLMFETQERILAADWYDIYGAKGIVRFPEVPLEIAAADRVAFVEVILPGQAETPFEQAFEALGVPFTAARPSSDLLVIIPAHPVDPALLGDGIGYQL